MSNPPEDPGHHPPPQPSGPYPGGYNQPPPQQYEQHPPPPPHYDQPPPNAYAPPPQPPGWQSPPARSPGRPRKGFFGALFDLDFNESITTQLIKVTYLLTILVYSLIAILMLILTQSFFDWNKPLGFITLIATPFVWFGGLLSTRLVLEFVVNQFKITEHLKALRERDERR